MHNIKYLLKLFERYLTKKILDKKRSKNILDINKVKSILFFRDDDKIGDMTVSTLLFREIKKKYPNIDIVVVCGTNSKEIIKYNKNVDQIYEIGNNFFTDILIFIKLRRQKITLGIDFYTFNLRFRHLLMLRLISSEILIGFHKNSYNIYDLSIDVDFFSTHISKKYEYLLKVLKIETPDLKYDIVLSPKEKNQAVEFVNKCNAKYRIILNPFAASKHRSFDFTKLKRLVKILEDKADCCLFVLCPVRSKKKMKFLETEKTVLVSFKSVLEVAALIKYSSAVITPDTSIVHIASAFQKKTVALYLDYSYSDEKINVIWGANNPNAIQLSVDTKKMNCENDVNRIPTTDIIVALRKLLSI
ncbi:MAG: hypothetical protein LBU29_03715 [Endomicrobium sp.]|jgi:ADP-heptose:LPS heptosyltransferase|nr:hypothetical protein [Endomicrobium sp.]